jgi:hypothetical protein
MKSNAFLELAERQISGASKARERAREKRTARKLASDRDQDLVDRSRQLKRWRVWRQERLDRALGDPRHGKALAKLIAWLGRAGTPSDEDLVAQARSWRHASASMRFLVLGLIDQAIVRKRERAGAPPFDDPLPGKPLSAFLAIRNILE